MKIPSDNLKIMLPDAPAPIACGSASEAVAALQSLYDLGTGFLRDQFSATLNGQKIEGRYRAFYPEIRLRTDSHSLVDSRLAFGYVAGPGEFATTITRPDLFASYLEAQIALLLENHDGPVMVGLSETPIPLHFAFLEGTHIDGSISGRLDRPLRDVFDVPDLSATDDKIVNSRLEPDAQDVVPLAPFTAQRIDYSLHRLAHYTATSPTHFQNYVLFTNYQFYVDEFITFAKAAVADPSSGYESLVEPGNLITTADGVEGESGISLC